MLESFDENRNRVVDQGRDFEYYLEKVYNSKAVDIFSKFWRLGGAGIVSGLIGDENVAKQAVMLAACMEYVHCDDKEESVTIVVQNPKKDFHGNIQHDIFISSGDNFGIKDTVLDFVKRSARVLYKPMLLNTITYHVSTALKPYLLK